MYFLKFILNLLIFASPYLSFMNILRHSSSFAILLNSKNLYALIIFKSFNASTVNFSLKLPEYISIYFDNSILFKFNNDFNSLN